MSKEGIYIPDVKVTVWTRIRDLFYRPWSKAQLAARVALSVANTYYDCWYERPRGLPAPVGTLRHSFTPLTDEEIAERNKKEDTNAPTTRPEN